MTPGPRDTSMLAPSMKVNGAPGGRFLNMSSSSSKTGSPRTTVLDHSHSHLTDLSHLSPINPVALPEQPTTSRPVPIAAALTSLGLLCLTSLMLALLALTFLVELTPLEEDDGGMREVTLALAALTLSLDLSCLLVCSAQFIFALKLTKAPDGPERTSKYLRQSSVSRVCAIGSFFVSVPVFLTGVILYTLAHFRSTTAVLTSVFIGLGIIFCGCAMIHNVFVWQREKTKTINQQNFHQSTIRDANHILRTFAASPLPNATLDLSGNLPTHELSTLV